MFLFLVSSFRRPRAPEYSTIFAREAPSAVIKTIRKKLSRLKPEEINCEVAIRVYEAPKKGVAFATREMTKSVAKTTRKPSESMAGDDSAILQRQVSLEVILRSVDFALK